MATLELWTFTVATPAVDLTGFKVEATDGGIGKVDEATYEAGGSFVVIDTGPWIFGRKVMLPAGVIHDIDLDTETIFVNLSKDEIKNAPEFDETRYREESYRDELAGYYGRAARTSSRNRSCLPTREAPLSGASPFVETGSPLVPEWGRADARFPSSPLESGGR